MLKSALPSTIPTDAVRSANPLVKQANYELRSRSPALSGVEGRLASELLILQLRHLK